jgi:hypothetical protein
MRGLSAQVSDLLRHPRYKDASPMHLCMTSGDRFTYYRFLSASRSGIPPSNAPDEAMLLTQPREQDGDLKTKYARTNNFVVPRAAAT